jgi:segregation and condensation protein A
VIAATLLDLKAARCCPPARVHDEEDLALLEVRDLLFARLLQYRAFKHVAEMFAELEAAALRSYPRRWRWRSATRTAARGDAGRRRRGFAQIAAAAFTPRPVPTVAPSTCTGDGVGARAGRAI